MINLRSGMEWFANFAVQQGVPLAIGEWGLWNNYTWGGSFLRHGGGDNPVYIENMYNWINNNNVAWHIYFMYGDVSHSLYDTHFFPLAIEKFQELWNPYY